MKLNISLQLFQIDSFFGCLKAAKLFENFNSLRFVFNFFEVKRADESYTFQ
jgi:hypothetical protein